MVDEIDRGQAEGVLAKKGERSNARSPGISELDEIGVTSQRVSEWREVRDAGEGVVDEVIARALKAGRTPTKTEILREATKDKRAAQKQAALKIGLLWKAPLSTKSKKSRNLFGGGMGRLANGMG